MNDTRFLRVLLERIAIFANTVVDGVMQQGRVKAFVHFLGAVLGPENAKKAVPVPLGTFLGYDNFQIDHDRILYETKLKHKDEEGNPARFVTYDEIYPELLTHVTRQISREFGKDIAANLKPEHLSGKSHLGWLQTGKSVKFDIGKDQWRIGDFLRSTIVPFARAVPVSELRMVPKEALSDGVAGILQPELLGLPAGTRGVYQIRAVVDSNTAADGTDPITSVWGLYKGLVLVHPGAKNVWAWHDGYGRTDQLKLVKEGPDRGQVVPGQAPAFIHVYNMLDIESFDPKSRYTLQGLWYQGVKHFYRALFSIGNIRAQVREDSRSWEQRLVAANAPVRALGGHGLTMTAGSLLGLSVTAGQSRVVVGAKAFTYIRGLEHIAHIEDDLRFFDNDTSFNKDEYPNKLPRFYAPGKLQGYFLKAGFGSQWAVNRRPDLPTGQCVLRHELAGFVPFNVFVVPSWSMLLSGCDFDGDMLVVMPPEERGGLYKCFNDLSLNEQRERLRGATTARKSAVRGLYKDSFERWAGQLEAGPILGMADIAARRFIDSQDPSSAWALQPWIQAAVDRQKRPIPWPNDAGPSAMNTPSAMEGYSYATDLLRDVTKVSARAVAADVLGFDEHDEYGDTQDLSSFQLAWSVFQSKVDSLGAIAAFRHYPTELIVSAEEELSLLMIRWGHELHIRMNRAIQELPHSMRRDEHNRVMHNPDGSVQLSQLPQAHVVDFPDRPLDEAGFLPLEEEHANMLSTVKLLDKYYVHALRDRVHGASRGLDNLKDGLVDAADYLGITEQLAQHCRSYRVFRYFATADQLRAYFSRQEGLRLADMFTVLDDRDFPESPFEAGVYRNAQALWIGFKYVQIGQVTLRVLPGGGFEIKTPLGEYESPANNIQDALVTLRMHFNAAVPLEVAEYRTTQPDADTIQLLNTFDFGQAPTLPAGAPAQDAQDLLSDLFGTRPEESQESAEFAPEPAAGTFADVDAFDFSFE